MWLGRSWASVRMKGVMCQEGRVHDACNALINHQCTKYIVYRVVCTM